MANGDFHLSRPAARQELPAYPCDLSYLEQPRVHDVDHGLEPRVADRLAIDGAHTRVDVSHDAVDRNLIFRLAGVSLEIVPQRVKVPMAVDAERAGKWSMPWSVGLWTPPPRPSRRWRALLGAESESVRLSAAKAIVDLSGKSGLC